MARVRDDGTSRPVRGDYGSGARASWSNHRKGGVAPIRRESDRHRPDDDQRARQSQVAREPDGEPHSVGARIAEHRPLPDVPWKSQDPGEEYARHERPKPPRKCTQQDNHGQRELEGPAGSNVQAVPDVRGAGDENDPGHPHETIGPRAGGDRHDGCAHDHEDFDDAGRDLSPREPAQMSPGPSRTVRGEVIDEPGREDQQGGSVGHEPRGAHALRRTDEDSAHCSAARNHEPQHGRHGAAPVVPDGEPLNHRRRTVRTETTLKMSSP